MLTPSQLAELIELNDYAITNGYIGTGWPDEGTYLVYEKGKTKLASRLVAAEEQVRALIVDELKQIDPNIDTTSGDYHDWAYGLDICLDVDDIEMQTPYGKALERKHSLLMEKKRDLPLCPGSTLTSLATALDGVDVAKSLLSNR